MSKKKHKPTFNEMLADLKKSTSKIPEGESKECNIDAAIQKEIPAVQVPKIEEKNNPSNQLFRWVFLPEVLRDRNDEFGFGKYKKNGHQFLNEIEVKIYTKYADKTWGDICALPHCGPYGKKAYLGIKKENYIVLSKNISVMKIYKRKFKNNCFTYHLVAAIGYLAFVTTQFFILF